MSLPPGGRIDTADIRVRVLTGQLDRPGRAESLIHILLREVDDLRARLAAVHALCQMPAYETGTARRARWVSADHVLALIDQEDDRG